MNAVADPNVASDLPRRLRTEIVVVGSGPGGAVTARTLAEAGREVLLLEEGSHHEQDSCDPFSRFEMVQKYRCRGTTLAHGRPGVVYVEGRCVGGGSEINSALYRRISPELLERWQRDFHVDALLEQDLRPHYEASEQELGVGPAPGPLPQASLKLREGASHVGGHCGETPRCIRWLPTEEGGWRPQRQSMSAVVVPKAVASGCRLLPDTRVLRLRSRGPGLTVEAVRRTATRRTQPLEVEADAVFSAAGAIHTPALLRRSGIRGGIGDGLQLQSMIKVVARFPEEVNAPDMGVPPDQVTGVSSRFSFGCSISAPAHIAMAMTDHPRHAREVVADWRRVAVYYAVIWGGEGTIRVLPGARDPLVRYRLDASDRADLTDAVRALSALLLAAGASEVYPAVRGIGPLRDEAELEQIPRPLPADRISLTSLHLSSSCRMRGGPGSPVDSFGRVRAAAGLHVSDASILCTAPGVNPQATIMAVARRNAQHFLGLERT
jgi:choline dehydrogenase-like flavoprotein